MSSTVTFRGDANKEDVFNQISLWEHPFIEAIYQIEVELGHLLFCALVLVAQGEHLT